MTTLPSMVPLEALANDMQLQMQSSAALLRSRYFAQPGRVDGALQRAHLANALRFYLERAQRHDLIPPASAEAIRNHLGKLEQPDIRFESKYEGYVLTPEPIKARTITLLQGGSILVRSIAALAEDFVVRAGEFESDAPVLSAETDGSTIDAASLGNAVIAGDRGSTPPVAAPLVADKHIAPESMPPPDGQHQDTIIADELPPEPLPPAAIEVHLGDADDQPVVWKPSVKGAPHLFMIGIPGQGKSVAISNILEDLLTQGVAPLILDFHGQFGASDGSLVQRYGLRTIDVAEGLPFNPFEVMERSGKPDWSQNAQATADVFAHVVDLGGIQKDGLYQSILDAYKAKGFDNKLTLDEAHHLDIPTTADVLHFIEQREAQRKVRNLAARCRSLLEMDLFNPDAPPLNLRDEIRKGLVIDLHAVPSEDVQMAAGTFVLRKVYREMFRWGEADHIRLVIVLDEAHRLAKDQTLPKIMKEGRKYGIAVVVASQGMRDFHPDVLSNAGTKVLFRINFPESRTLSQYIKGPPRKQIDSLVEQLPVGRAFVQTPEMQIGRHVQMRRPIKDQRE